MVNVVRMKISKTRTLWGIYIAGLTVFFLYYLFPSESIKNYVTFQINHLNSKVNITIQDVKLTFPPGIRLDGVYLHYLRDIVGRIEKIKLHPDILSLFSGAKKFTFNGSAYAGTISGNAKIGFNAAMPQVVVNSTFADLQVKDIEGLQRVSMHKIMGLLAGKVAYASAGGNRSLTGKLTMSNCKVQFNIPVLNLAELTFTNAAADLKLSNQNLTIQRCRLEGNLLDAGISGSVFLNGRTSESGLNLSATIKPHDDLLAQLDKILPVDLLAGQKRDGQGIVFEIRGTVGAPEFSFN